MIPDESSPPSGSNRRGIGPDSASELAARLPPLEAAPTVAGSPAEPSREFTRGHRGAPPPALAPTEPGSRRPDRRAFLASAAAAGAAACGWDGGSTLKPVLAGVSRFNDRVSELLFSPSREAPKYDPAERSHTFPNYHISRMTPTLPDPEGWRLEVGGLVRTPLSLALEEVRALGRLTYTVKHHCVEGWSAVATWSGVPFRALAERAGMLPGARYVRFDSFDAGYFNGWDLKSAMHPETILAYGFNDRDLMPDHGAPLRLYAPHKLGYKLTKYLTRVTFAADRPGGYWEDQGYPWFAGV
jgi:DMSO/TMAO reductase YedYZ molybdopterin-dependent catalytic subunit